MVILVRASFANSGLYMAFGFSFATALGLWLQTLVAVDSESCQRSFPSFAHCHLKWLAPGRA